MTFFVRLLCINSVLRLFSLRNVVILYVVLPCLMLTSVFYVMDCNRVRNMPVSDYA